MANYEIISLVEGTPQLRAPGAGNGYLAPRPVTITPDAGSALTLTGGTVTTSNPLIDATQTWNAGAVTFTGWKLNVTNTASAAASLLMDLQVGGATKFNVRSDGRFFGPVWSNIAGTALLSIETVGSGTGVALYTAGTSGFNIGSVSGSYQISGDTILARDAANTLALRNSTNAQTFNVYNTYTDASNYERLQILYSGNIAYVRTAKAGTGSDRVLVFNASGDTTQSLAIGLNEVTFGKTQKFGTDNTYDIGATGASRPRTAYFGTSAIVQGTGGLGYGTGAGGTVTQTTSRTTGVTLNTPTGAITLVSAAGSTSWQTFTVTNSTVAATDTVIVVQKSGTDLNEIHVTAVAAGSFNISFRTTGGTTTEQPVFNFAVIKGAAS